VIDQLYRVIIGAPFGNYLYTPGCTSTVGTYTVENRAGRFRWWLFWRLLGTLRWRRALGGWTNKLGLPNPGIEHLKALGNSCKDKIVSIHGFNDADWTRLLEATAIHLYPYLAAIELNISCPNIGHMSVPTDLFSRALFYTQDKKLAVIVKLPPVSYWKTFELAYSSGIRNFHCCNTLPVPVGGLSGKTLMRVSLDVIERIKQAKPDVTIIGGGGITTPDDVETYWNAGAEHFAVASKLLDPRVTLAPWRDKLLFSLAARADELWWSASAQRQEKPKDP